MANPRMRELEREAAKFAERYRRDRYDRNEPSFATFKQDKLDDKLTREAAERLLAPTTPDEDVSESDSTDGDVTDDDVPATVATIKTLIVGNFKQVVIDYYDDCLNHMAEKGERAPTAADHWLRRRGQQHPELGDIETYRLVLNLDHVNGTYHRFALEHFEIPANTFVPPGVYRLGIERVETNTGRDWIRWVASDLYFHIHGERFDLAAAAPLTHVEITTALAPPPPEPDPAPPQFRRTRRKQGDSASRLGFVVGLSESDVQLPKSWAWHAFNLPHPAVIGSVEAIVTMNYADNTFELDSITRPAIGCCRNDCRTSAAGTSGRNSTSCVWKRAITSSHGEVADCQAEARTRTPMLDCSRQDCLRDRC
jgi:hypothetical protein